MMLFRLCSFVQSQQIAATNSLYCPRSSQGGSSQGTGSWILALRGVLDPGSSLRTPECWFLIGSWFLAPFYGVWVLQSLTGYLRLALFLCEIAHYRKSLISVFQEFFASINKVFILAGRLGTRLLFYEVLGLS